MRKIFPYLFILFSFSVAKTQDIKGGYFSYQDIDNIRYEGTCFLHVDPSMDLNRPFLILETGSSHDTLFFAYETMLSPSIKKKVYHGIFYYPPPGTWIMSTSEPYRISGIDNFSNSQFEIFRLESKLIVSPFFSRNNNAQIFNYPNDIFLNGSSFNFIPNVWDPDGDSLVFSLVPCYGGSYVMPDSIYIDSISGEISFVPDSNGIYSVCFMIQEWREVSTNFFIDVGYSIHEILFEINDLGLSELINSDFTIYPNPNNGDFNLSFSAGFSFADIKIYDGLGRIVFSEKQKNISEANVFPLKIPGNIPGLYMISVETEKGIFTSKILVD